jgi:hypothetical protein
MVMMVSPDSALSSRKVKVRGDWVVRERRGGVVVAERNFKNIWTTYGLTALAGAITGNGYTAPVYLVIENNATTLAATANPGDTQVQLAARVDQAGDTQLVLDPGAGNQEVVSFTSVSGSGPYVYLLTSTIAQTHTFGAAVVRQVSENDTMASVVNEEQYDSVNFPGLRMQSPSGYSSGPGNCTIQFYFPGPTSVLTFMTCGLADSPTIGAGNLHNHFILGYSNTDAGTDVEIDGSLTLSNP